MRLLDATEPAGNDVRHLVAAIRRIFTNELEVRVSRDTVTVTSGGQVRSFRPVVHVSTRAGRTEIIGVGDTFRSVEPSRPVPLLGQLPDGVTAETWDEALSFFMRYVMANARFGLVAVRPVVRVAERVE